MKIVVSLALSLIVIVPSVSEAVASLDRLIPFQARLTDASGDPVPDGVYELTFSIWDVPAGGDGPVVQEVHPTASVIGGVVNVLLGGIVPLGELSFGESAYYLGIKVGEGQEMVPRHQLVPAFHSRTADVASRAEEADLATLATNALYAQEAGYAEEAGVAFTLDGFEADEAFDNLQSAYERGRIIEANNGAVEIDGNGGLRVAGAVGIGTDSPRQELHISSGITGDAGLIIEANTDNDHEHEDYQPFIQFEQDGGLVTGQIGYFAGTNHLRLKTDGITRIVIEEDGGDVGIGTTNPSATLHVGGDLKVDGDIVNLKGSNTYVATRTTSQGHGTTDVRMKPTGNSVCFLWGVRMQNTDIEDEYAGCDIDQRPQPDGDGYWHLEAQLGNAGGPDADVWCQAGCLTW